MAIAIVIVVAFVGIGVGVLVAGGSDSDPASDLSAQDADADGAELGTDESPGGSDDELSGDDATDSDPDTSSVTLTIPETTPPTTAAVTATTLDLEPYDRWITILHSRSKDEFGLEQVNAEAAAMAASHGGDSRVRVVDSDASRHMNANYWVIILADFGSRAEAIAGCADYGIPVGDCYARQTLTGARDE